MSSDAAAALDLPVPTLADGAVADVALIDPEAVVTVGADGFQSKSRNSAWRGEELHGTGQPHDRRRVGSHGEQ